MTVTSDAATKGQKEIWTKWPEETGLTVGTTKQEGRQIALVPIKGSNVPKKDRVGLDI